jgi:glycosyltransferase involved in cell wall biosynthesis
LRKLGVDSDLIIERPSHVASLPQWEDGEVNMDLLGDPYNPNWDAFNWKIPDWVHVWNTRKSWHPFSRTTRLLRVLSMLREYDLIIGHAPFAKVASVYHRLCRKPYVIYDAGWIRYLPRNLPDYRRARKGYHDASMILFTNVDTESMFKEQGYDNLMYTPFAIDTEKYAPENVPRSKDPVLFHPSRHDWPEKGNDRLIRAFSAYVKRRPKAKLVMVEWCRLPKELAKSKQLVEQLDLQRNVQWVPVMPKNKLIEFYHHSTAVFDQFVFGAFGTTAPEAMSCGRPVVGYVETKFWSEYHDSVPPVINASTVHEIYQAMIVLEDETARDAYAKQGRKWILDNCDAKLVATRQLQMYEEILR